MLTDYGYGNLAYLVATNLTAPGLGQWFTPCGATTTWEAWGTTRATRPVPMTTHSWERSTTGCSPTCGDPVHRPRLRTVAVDPTPVEGLTYASATRPVRWDA
jgi:hypothetical protein